MRGKPAGAGVVPLPFRPPPLASARQNVGMAGAVGHNPDDRRYTTEHEWVKADGEQYVVGITAFAQDQLGDIVYVELPKVGRSGRGGQTVRGHRIGQDRVRPVRAGLG